MHDKTGLSEKAYRPLNADESYEPFVPASESPVEVSIKTIVAGILFGILFGAANAYLGLYAGLTISTSIPVAVMTVAAVRVWSTSSAPAKAPWKASASHLIM